jgi:hypothetical protein
MIQDVAAQGRVRMKLVFPRGEPEALRKWTIKPQDISALLFGQTKNGVRQVMDGARCAVS